MSHNLYAVTEEYGVTGNAADEQCQDMDDSESDEWDDNAIAELTSLKSVLCDYEVKIHGNSLKPFDNFF